MIPYNNNDRQLHKRSLFMESTQQTSTNDNTSTTQDYMTLKKSSINFGSGNLMYNLPKTPIGNHQPLTFSHHKPAKLQQMAKQASFQKSFQEVNDKINKLSQQMMKHQLEITSLQLRSNRGQQNIQLHQGDLSNKRSQKNIPQIEEIPTLLTNCQRQILNMKKQIQNSMSNDDMMIFASETQQKINEMLQPIKLTIKEENNKNTLKIAEEVEKLQKNIKKQLMDTIQYNNTQIKELLQKFQIELSANTRAISIIKPKKSKITSLTDTTNLKYLQHFQVVTPQNTKLTLLFNQLTFKIDSQGYLLDFQGFYLLDTYNSQIRLDQKHLEILKKKNILR